MKKHILFSILITMSLYANNIDIWKKFKTEAEQTKQILPIQIKMDNIISKKIIILITNVLIDDKSKDIKYQYMFLEPTNIAYNTINNNDIEESIKIVEKSLKKDIANNKEYIEYLELGYTLTFVFNNTKTLTITKQNATI